jgi:hypothetical protein
MVLGVILAIIILALAAWFFMGSFRGPTVEPARPGGDTNIEINPPAPAAPKVDVEVNPPGQQAPPAQQAPAGQNQPAPKAP